MKSSRLRTGATPKTQKSLKIIITKKYTHFFIRKTFIRK